MAYDWNEDLDLSFAFSTLNELDISFEGLNYDFGASKSYADPLITNFNSLLFVFYLGKLLEHILLGLWVNPFARVCHQSL